MMKFISSLFGNRAPLSVLEKLILDVIRTRLDDDVLGLWDRQVASINKVQRLPDGVEVNFYRMQGGKVHFDPAMAFPNQSKEMPVANVTLNFASQRLVAKVWVVNGHIFSIEYVGGSKYFEEALGMDPPPKFEVHCELLADLTQSA